MHKLYPKGSPQYINKLNKIRILNIIREKGQISRADIAKISGISAPTVTRIVDSLIHEENLVTEIGIGESSGGRRPTLVEFSGLDNFVIGIDLGTTHIDGVLSDLNSTTIAKLRVNTNIEEGFEQITQKIVNIICDLRNHKQVVGKKILGAGLAVPGLINRENNIIEISPDLHWESVDLKKILQEKCDLPVKFDNVTRVMALGEMWYGIGHKVRHFAVVNIGYGIGAGFIIDGKPLYGPYGLAGEFGHMTMNKDSDIQCACGNYGCLEALSSGHAIANRIVSEIEAGSTTKLKELVNGDLQAITTKMVAEAARNGDPLSIEVFEEAVDYLGAAIASLINLFSPEMVLLGGGVVQAEDLIFDRLREIVSRRTIKTRTRNIDIQPVTFGMQAATKGAVALILNEALQLNYLEQPGIDRRSRI